MEPHGVPLRLAHAIPVHAEPRHAGFRDLKTLDQFDWEFNTSLPRKQLFELATCRFLDDDPKPGSIPAENPKLASASTGNRRPKPATDADDATDQTVTI